MSMTIKVDTVEREFYVASLIWAASDINHPYNRLANLYLFNLSMVQGPFSRIWWYIRLAHDRHTWNYVTRPKV